MLLVAPAPPLQVVPAGGVCVGSIRVLASCFQSAPFLWHISLYGKASRKGQPHAISTACCSSGLPDRLAAYATAAHHQQLHHKASPTAHTARVPPKQTQVWLAPCTHTC